MASFLRPKRGKKSTAIDKLTGTNVLVSGELFMEVPEEGIGKGQGKIKMGDGITDYKDLPYFIDPDPGKLKMGRVAKVYTEINSAGCYFIEGGLYVPTGTYTINLEIRTDFGTINDSRLFAGFFDTGNNWYEMESLFPQYINYWKSYSLNKIFTFTEAKFIYPAIKSSSNGFSAIKDGKDPNTGLNVNSELNGYQPIYKLSKGGIYISGGLPIYYNSNQTDCYLKKKDGLYYKCDSSGIITAGTTGVSSISGYAYNHAIEATNSYSIGSGDSRIIFRLSARKENSYEQKYLDSTGTGTDDWGYSYIEDVNGINVQSSLPYRDE